MLHRGTTLYYNYSREIDALLTDDDWLLMRTLERICADYQIRNVPWDTLDLQWALERKRLSHVHKLTADPSAALLRLVRLGAVVVSRDTITLSPGIHSK